MSSSYLLFLTSIIVSNTNYVIKFVLVEHLAVEVIIRTEF